MKPTNDERRAAAIRVRRLVHEKRPTVGEFYKCLVRAVMGTWDYYCPDDLINRLADLIEPEPERTCRMEYDPVHCDYVCTNCGEWHDTGMYDACDADDRIVFKPYRYCPECGARVEVER